MAPIDRGVRGECLPLCVRGWTGGRGRGIATLAAELAWPADLVRPRMLLLFTLHFIRKCWLMMDGQVGGVVFDVRQSWAEGRRLRHSCVPVGLHEDGRVAVLDSAASKLVQCAFLWAIGLLSVVGGHVVRMEQGHASAADIMLGSTSSIKTTSIAESTLGRPSVLCRVLQACDFAGLEGLELLPRVRRQN